VVRLRPALPKPIAPFGLTWYCPQDELIGNWTLAGDELEQLAGRRGATKLGFALLLRFYAVHGRFPAGRSEIPDQAVAHAAVRPSTDNFAPDH
jgi:hypothetical protein